MKKACVILLMPVIISFLSFGKDKEYNNGSPRLPVYVSYKYNSSIVPDSIKNLISLYLKAKKIKIVNEDELTALVAAEINSTLTSLINSGSLNERTAKNIGDRVDAVGNVVAIQLFNNRQVEDSFIIDSIYWRTKTVPAKDSIWMHKEMFIPDSTSKVSADKALKLFVDKLISSGYLQ